MPQYGHKKWYSYFGRTFDVFTKLWKFQQLNRPTLDSKYGLKRWQIGEIASKIGQLYYYFYLRTSDTTYLKESCAFYQAIRGRSYYSNACNEDKCDLLIKKMRYYARFIVVALLLKRMVLVEELVHELEWEVGEYGNVYNRNDKYDWVLVVKEIKAFLVAECVVNIYANPDINSIAVTQRLRDVALRPFERTPSMTLTLYGALIVNCNSEQTKYSEMTVDMYRMILTLDHDPPGYYRSGHNRAYSEIGYPENPFKCLLYKPSSTQILVHLGNTTQELPPNGALLVFITADGYYSSENRGTEPYNTGGIVTYSRYMPEYDPGSTTQPLQMHCLYPGDIGPYTRKPLFLIVDSDNSYTFRNIPRQFGQPLVILMSPIDLPQPCREQQRQGSLFTLFLHSPLAAFCNVCEIYSMPYTVWQICQRYLDSFMSEATRLILNSTNIDSSYIKFFGDEFLRTFILRYIFCEVVIRSHRKFRSNKYKPACSPQLPEAEILESAILANIVYDLAKYLHIEPVFFEPLPLPANAEPAQPQPGPSHQNVIVRQPTASQPIPNEIIYQGSDDPVRQGHVE